jgi:hypothetical protein
MECVADSEGQNSYEVSEESEESGEHERGRDVK